MTNSTEPDRVYQVTEASQVITTEATTEAGATEPLSEATYEEWQAAAEPVEPAKPGYTTSQWLILLVLILLNLLVIGLAWLALTGRLTL